MFPIYNNTMERVGLKYFMKITWSLERKGTGTRSQKKQNKSKNFWRK